jgi:NAD+ diphosphatase
MPDRPAFTANPLDRASEKRSDPVWLEAQLGDPDSRFLALHDLNALVISGDEPRLAWATSDVREHEREATGAVLLGLRDGVAHFAVDVSSTEKPEVALGVEGAAAFTEIRALASTLAAEDAAIVAQARALLDWHMHHSFCSNCGEKTRPVQGGSVRLCIDCQTEHFPRVNPVVIMTVTRGERCLLGRQKGWPAGMYSALAGFVEVGETLEDAARREVFEEAGIRVGAVRYLESQPWPFPSSLMIGCTCEAESEEISVDLVELQDAKWFEREQVRKAIELPGSVDEFFVPPAMSIAHHLLRAWAF